MKKFAVSLFCFGLAALAAVAGDQKTAKIDGTWIATGGVTEGKKLPPEIIEKINLTVHIKDGKYNVSVQGKEVESGTYKTDAAKKPATIDMTIKSGKDAGKMQLGIYKLEGDNLTLTVGKAGTSRPKTFDADDAEITMLKRKK